MRAWMGKGLRFRLMETLWDITEMVTLRCCGYNEHHWIVNLKVGYFYIMRISLNGDIFFLKKKKNHRYIDKRGQRRAIKGPDGHLCWFLWASSFHRLHLPLGTCSGSVAFLHVPPSIDHTNREGETRVSLSSETF